MIKESEYSFKLIKKKINKSCVMTKKDQEDFNNSTKCWICNKSM